MTGWRFLDSLSSHLTFQDQAKLVPVKSAGVAVIFRKEKEGEQVLLIRRAERQGDPWSGQVAFPGGMVSAADRSFEDTAIRETFEEVGVDLSKGRAVFLGYMHEFKARTREVVVVPSVFRLIADPELRPNDEVASCEWAPLKELAADEARSTYIHNTVGGAKVPFPSLVHRGLVVWGLTERILSVVLEGRTGDDGVLGNIERY